MTLTLANVDAGHALIVVDGNGRPVRAFPHTFDVHAVHDVVLPPDAIDVPHRIVVVMAVVIDDEVVFIIVIFITVVISVVITPSVHSARRASTVVRCIISPAAAAAISMTPASIVAGGVNVVQADATLTNIPLA